MQYYPLSEKGAKRLLQVYREGNIAGRWYFPGFYITLCRHGFVETVRPDEEAWLKSGRTIPRDISSWLHIVNGKGIQYLKSKNLI